jgi:alkyl hydroperoxide reductase subunit F
MLDATLKSQLQAYLTKLVHPIELVASLDDSDRRANCRPAGRIAGLSNQITLSSARRRRAQAVVLDPPQGRAPRVRFAGIPLGHEFTSLVLALLQVGGHPPKVEPEVIEQIKALDADFELRSLHVAELPQLPGRGAGAQPDGRAEPAHPHVTIDGALFQEEVEGRARSWRCRWCS